MALNFQLFDSTFQTSNFYLAIAKIEQNSFSDGIYPIFEWSGDYAIFSNSITIDCIKQFFQKNNIEYELMWETELYQWKLIIVHTNNSNLAFPTLLEQARVIQSVDSCIH